MPRPGPTNPSRPAILALAIVVWLALPFGARPARASGCHVDERPVLGVDALETAGHHIAVWEMADEDRIAPPVLTRVPCPVQTPHASPIAFHLIGAAWLSDRILIPRTSSGTCHPATDADRRDPHPFRLDRPPR